MASKRNDFAIRLLHYGSAVCFFTGLKLHPSVLALKNWFRGIYTKSRVHETHL